MAAWDSQKQKILETSSDPAPEGLKLFSGEGFLLLWHVDFGGSEISSSRGRRFLKKSTGFFAKKVKRTPKETSRKLERK